MKNFLIKLEWYTPKLGAGKYGLHLWRLGDFEVAIATIPGSKKNEDFILPEENFSSEVEENVVRSHLKDYAIRLRRIGFKEGFYHGRKITRSGAIGVATILGLSPVDFWYMAHIDKKDPGAEFWQAINYFNDLELDFD